jgi:hypothetical protein
MTDIHKQPAAPSRRRFMLARRLRISAVAAATATLTAVLTAGGMAPALARPRLLGGPPEASGRSPART